MAKNLIFIDQDVLDKLTHSLRGAGLKYENDYSVYYVIGGIYDDRSSLGKPPTKTQKDREEFRAKLDELGHPEATVFTHWALEAYDKIHCPELRPMKLFERTSVDGGVVRLETWPEGLVLWVNGKIKYKRWEDTDK